MTANQLVHIVPHVVGQKSARINQAYQDQRQDWCLQECQEQQLLEGSPEKPQGSLLAVESFLPQVCRLEWGAAARR